MGVIGLCIGKDLYIYVYACMYIDMCIQIAFLSKMGVIGLYIGKDVYIYVYVCIYVNIYVFICEYV
jgi:hypothetical protein